MTEDEIIIGILEREGGWRPETPRPNAPPDPATNRGITLDTLRKYLQNPALTAQDLRDMPPSLAEEIYRAWYIYEPGFTPANIPFEPLRVQLIDFGVNSDPARAVRWFQRVLGVPVSGEFDQNTHNRLSGLMHFDESDGVTEWHLINDALVAARCHMITASVKDGTINKADELGLLTRAVSFSVVGV